MSSLRRFKRKLHKIDSNCIICEEIVDVKKATLEHILPKKLIKQNNFFGLSHYFCNQVKADGGFIESCKKVNYFKNKNPDLFKSMISINNSSTKDELIFCGFVLKGMRRGMYE